jgi:hypothetical protein
VGVSVVVPSPYPDTPYPYSAAARTIKFVQTGTAGVNWRSVYGVEVEVIE